MQQTSIFISKQTFSLKKENKTENLHTDDKFTSPVKIIKKKLKSDH